jgi:hypothetical protein
MGPGERPKHAYMGGKVRTRRLVCGPRELLAGRPDYGDDTLENDEEGRDQSARAGYS